MQNDFIIALAWPEGMVSACGSWYDVFFAKNKKYRVGHSALVLVESVTGNLRYFDFGRYHTPKDFGRVRDVITDGDVTIETIAKIEKNQDVECSKCNLDRVNVNHNKPNAIRNKHRRYRR